MFKRLIYTVTALVVILSLAACAGDAGDAAPAVGTAPDAGPANNNGNDTAPAGDVTAGAAAQTGFLEQFPMSTENITLTASFWHEDPINLYLIDRFMEIHPNITVNFVNLEDGGWNENLSVMAGAGNLPDVFGMMFHPQLAVINEWAMDITDIYNADPDTQYIYDMFQPYGVINGRRYFMPVWQQIRAILLNMTMFEEFNEPLPDWDWTHEEMMEIARRLSRPEDFYWGLQGVAWWEDYDVIWGESYMYGYDPFMGPFGTYHLGANWANGINSHHDMRHLGVIYYMSGEDREAMWGDPHRNPFDEGRIAMRYIHFSNLEDWGFLGQHYIDRGLYFDIWPYPGGRIGSVVPSTPDTGFISDTTPYPNDAWQLMKFMTWGAEGWHHRLDAYLYHDFTFKRMPFIDNQELWDRMISLAATPGMAEVFRRADRGVPQVEKWVPGLHDYIAWEWQETGGGVSRDIFNWRERPRNPHDYVELYNEMLNHFLNQVGEEIVAIRQR